MSRRRSPRRNIPASTFVQWLDSHRRWGVDLEGYERPFINGFEIDKDTKREIRRWRNGHVLSIRPEVAQRIADMFNLTMEEFDGFTQDHQGSTDLDRGRDH
jgi:hypothetical protein